MAPVEWHSPARIAALSFRTLAIGVIAFALSGCGPDPEQTEELAVEIVDSVDPMATDFFFMRNPEIREDLLEQLEIHEVDFWINDDNSIGFYVKDTEEVDRIANESISVWITSQ